MKHVLHSLIISLLLPSYPLHAMDDDLGDLMCFEEEEEEQDEDKKEDQDELEEEYEEEQEEEQKDQIKNTANQAIRSENPIFRMPPPPLHPPPQSNLILSFKRSNPNTNPPADSGNTQSASKNPFLSPPNKRQSLAEEEDDNDYMPSLEMQPINKKPKVPEKPLFNLEREVYSITAKLKKETLRKFTYDMERMKELNPHAYAMTLLCLQVSRLRNEDFLYVQNIKGTPDIIRYIEEKKWYQFPENIVVRTKQYPHASSLADMAACTEKRVRDQKNFLIDTGPYSKSEREKISEKMGYDNISSAPLIEGAIYTYLDQIDAAENETPDERTERVYRNAYELLFPPAQKITTLKFSIKRAKNS